MVWRKCETFESCFCDHDLSYANSLCVSVCTRTGVGRVRMYAFFLVWGFAWIFLEIFGVCCVIFIRVWVEIFFGYDELITWFFGKVFLQNTVARRGASNTSLTTGREVIAPYVTYYLQLYIYIMCYIIVFILMSSYVISIYLKDVYLWFLCMRFEKAGGCLLCLGLYSDDSSVCLLVQILNVFQIQWFVIWVILYSVLMIFWCCAHDPRECIHIYLVMLMVVDDWNDHVYIQNC